MRLPTSLLIFFCPSANKASVNEGIPSIREFHRRHFLNFDPRKQFKKLFENLLKSVRKRNLKSFLKNFKKPFEKLFEKLLKKAI